MPEKKGAEEMLNKKTTYWFRREKEDAALPEKLQLLTEIQKAHNEWVSAQLKLDWVLEKDQIDYAIFALEAAEKRYEMLLRQAKQEGWSQSPRTMMQGGA